MKTRLVWTTLAFSALALAAAPQGANADTLTVTVDQFANTSTAPTNYGVVAPLSSPAPVNYSVESGSVGNEYRTPFASSTEQYSAVDAGPPVNGPGTPGSAYYNVVGASAVPGSYTFLWGSPDSYNEVILYSGPGGTGTDEGTVYGNQLSCYGIAGGCTDIGYAVVTIADTTEGIGSVEFYDTGTAAFEYAQTPLPAALTLFASGLGVVGMFGLRRKRKGPVALAA